jgi:hypothetical protein
MGFFEQGRGGCRRLQHCEHSITQGFSCVPNGALAINQHRTQRYFYIRHDLEPASLTIKLLSEPAAFTVFEQLENTF